MTPRRSVAPLVLLFVMATGCAGTDEGLSSAPPLPYQGTEPPASPADEAEADASRRLAAWLRANCDGDLAYRRPVRASNVRAGSARYTPSALTDGDPATYWTTDELVTKASVTIELGAPTRFDHVVLQESIELGRRVTDWTLAVRNAGDWTEMARGSGIGAVRTVGFEPTTGDALRLSVDSARACPVLHSVEVYAAGRRPDLSRITTRP